ncbi:MAG: TonB family protein [Chitinispirillales bacterium]|jgi:TonB family protein|nr:TonB family protein [Chitinispirillales bacterium]
MTKYKILIKKCEDPQRASGIADEAARFSGSTPDVVFNAITQKAVCIRKEADEEEALRLKQRFIAYGAEVDLISLNDGGTAPYPVGTAVHGEAGSGGYDNNNYDNEDDDEEEGGRILTDAEYAEAVKNRSDIFIVEKESRQRNFQLTAFILAVGFIAFMGTRKVIAVVAPDFLDGSIERQAKLVRSDEIQAALDKKKDEENKEQEEIKTDQKKLTPQKSKGAGGTTGGGGDPRERVAQMGVLSLVSGQVKGRSIANADIFGKGGFASDIDAVLSGIGGLRSGGGGGTGRKGVAGIGFGEGFGSGFGGGGGGGIDDLISGLMGPGVGGLDLKKRGELKVSSPGFTEGGQLTGGRSRASIQRVVLQNMNALRHAYNQRLRQKPGLNGKITVKFAIDEFGKVIFAQIAESTLADPELEKTVVDRVKTWNFDKIDKPGDVTEVVYPFVFSQ